MGGVGQEASSKGQCDSRAYDWGSSLFRELPPAMVTTCFLWLLQNSSAVGSPAHALGVRKSPGWEALLLVIGEPSGPAKLPNLLSASITSL